MMNQTTTGVVATSDMFARWTDRAVSMSVAELNYAIHDCASTAAACERFDGVTAGRYRDELATYRMELNARGVR